MAELDLQPVTPILEQGVLDKDFGEPAIDTGKFSVTIADRPVGLNVAALSERLEKPIPPEVDLYQRFAVWLIPNRVSIIRRSSLAEVTSVGIECEYLNGSKTCSIVSLLPAPQFIVWGKVDGSIHCAGNLSFVGETLPASGDMGVVRINEAGIGFGTSATAKVSASFNVNVVTPYISAVGIGSSRAEWRFDRHEEALFGRDITTWATVLLPKRQKELELRMRAYVTLRTLFVPTRHESIWQNVTCLLGG